MGFRWAVAQVRVVGFTGFGQDEWQTGGTIAQEVQAGSFLASNYCPCILPNGNCFLLPVLGAEAAFICLALGRHSPQLVQALGTYI